MLNVVFISSVYSLSNLWIFEIEDKKSSLFSDSVICSVKYVCTCRLYSTCV